MKILFSIFVSYLLLLPSLGNMMVYFTFKINQEQISKTICVQKDLVVNTCNGRCVLEKKLKQLEKQQHKTENNLKEKSQLVYIPIFLKQSKFPFILKSLQQQFASIISKKYEAKLYKVFHPPLA